MVGMTPLTVAQLRAKPWWLPLCRYHYGLGPRPADAPHMTLPAYQAAYDEWHRFDVWRAWVKLGKPKPRPPVWTRVPRWAWTVAAEQDAQKPKPPPTPPKPPPFKPDPRLQRVAVGAWNVLDALAWPGCNIWFSADPAESLSRFVTSTNADICRDQGHGVGTWYVPDQVPYERAAEAAKILGTDLIVADCETKLRMRLAMAKGVTHGITNLSDICEVRDGKYVAPDLVAAIAERRFHIINEYYWNQSKRKQPDNHHLPVHSICIAVYNGCSDSSEPDCWEPHIPQYEEAGYLWPDVSVYTQNMTTADWKLMPR